MPAVAKFTEHDELTTIHREKDGTFSWCHRDRQGEETSKKGYKTAQTAYKYSPIKQRFSIDQYILKTIVKE